MAQMVLTTLLQPVHNCHKYKCIANGIAQSTNINDMKLVARD